MVQTTLCNFFVPYWVLLQHRELKQEHEDVFLVQYESLGNVEGRFRNSDLGEKGLHGR